MTRLCHTNFSFQLGIRPSCSPRFQ